MIGKTTDDIPQAPTYIAPSGLPGVVATLCPQGYLHKWEILHPFNRWATMDTYISPTLWEEYVEWML